MKGFAIGVGFFLGLALLFSVLYWGGILSNKVQESYNKATVTTKIGQVVNTPGFAQAAYEKFYQECADVVADNDKIDAQKELIASIKAEPNDNLGQKTQALSEALSDLDGIEQLQTQVAADYNAQSQEWTRNTFKSVDLPESLEAPYNYLCD